jgi:DNA repair exonuclease SbcCD nuclease subunit
MQRIGILHTADFHFRADDAYISDVALATKKIHTVASRDGSLVDLIVIVGDIFHERLSVDSNGVTAAIDTMRCFASAKPVVMLAGTATHDVGNSLAIFEKLKTKFPIKVISTPGVYDIAIPSATSPMQSDKSIRFYCVPGIRKRFFKSLAEQYGIDINKMTSAELVELQIKEWGRNKPPGKFDDVIFLGHFQLQGCKFDIMESGYEPLVSADLIRREINPSLILLGHIHEGMKFGNAFYSGSPVSNDMSDAVIVRASDSRVIGDKQKKGFYLHDRDGTGRWASKFISVDESRSFIKILATTDDMKDVSKIKNIIDKHGDNGQVVARIYIETTDDKTQLVHTFNENLMGVLGENVLLMPPKVKIASFGASRRVGDSELWVRMTDDEKFFAWASAKKVEIADNEISDYKLKINSI